MYSAIWWGVLVTNQEIDTQMQILVKSERKITREILELIQRAEHQRLPLERGFKDTYDWLIRGHGYSASAANRRIQASRLLSEIPEAAAKVESGQLNLTLLWQAQKVIRAQRKTTGQKVSRHEKMAALAKIEGKTSEVAERELHSMFPEADVTVQKIVQKHDGGIGLTIELSATDARELKRAQELLSHAMPGASLSEVITRLARDFNKRNDPLMKQGSTARRSMVLQKAEGKCTFKDSRTGRVCGSTFQVEMDHWIPRALGGSNELRNLRSLCRKHNGFEAERKLGRRFMDYKLAQSKSNFVR